MQYVRGPERARAVASLDRYLGHSTGAFFERSRDSSLVHRITEKDLLAVTMLGGGVPPLTAVWLLGPGAAEITARLVQVPRTESALWDPAVSIGRGSPLDALVRLVGGRPGMTRAKTSRLLAAKRPNLVPICDRPTRRALGIHRALDERAEWQALFRDPKVRGEVIGLRAEVPAAVDLSLLRVMHIVVTMRMGGWDGPEDDPFPPFGARRKR
jgi:hypothetical protein